MSDVKCPVCENNSLVVKISYNSVEHNGKTKSLPHQYSECSICGCSTVTVEQSRLNKRSRLAFKKEADGLLTGSEVREIREQLDITQDLAARIFGGGPVAFSKYETDDVAQSEAMDLLLRAAILDRNAFSTFCRIRNISITASKRPGQLGAEILDENHTKLKRFTLISPDKEECSKSSSHIEVQRISSSSLRPHKGQKVRKSHELGKVNYSSTVAA